MDAFLWRGRLKDAKRIVIKLGSNTIIKDDRFNCGLAEDLARQIRELYPEKRFIIVTSGAIGLGRMHLAHEKTDDILLKQCLASVGQNILMHSYQDCFAMHGIRISQLLLTNDDLRDEKRKTNLKCILAKLASMGITTIINENDSVSTEEMTFGDNDILSAHISNLVEADLLILLSDVDGLYRNIYTKEIIDLVDDVDHRIMGFLDDKKSEMGTGGMRSKIAAAQIAAYSKTATVVANGSEKDVIRRILEGDMLGTMFKLDRGNQNG